MCDIFSEVSVRAFVSDRSGVIFPEITLNRLNLPYWSLSVLYTRTVGEPVSAHGTSSPSTVVSAPPSSGDGNRLTIALSSSCVPRPVIGMPQNTGKSVRSRTPAFSPRSFSSSVNSSPSKYLSISSSSVSATDSFTAT